MSAIGYHACRSVRLSLAIQLSGKAHEDSDHTIMITDALCTHSHHGGEVVAAFLPPPLLTSTGLTQGKSHKIIQTWTNSQIVQNIYTTVYRCTRQVGDVWWWWWWGGGGEGKGDLCFFEAWIIRRGLVGCSYKYIVLCIL